jgi:hypothetical protein
MGNYVTDLSRDLKAKLGGVPRATHMNDTAQGRLGETHANPRQSELYFRVTLDKTERLWSPAGLKGVYKNNLYVGGGAGMWKWNGNQFEGVSAEEVQRFETATDGLPSPEFSDYQGWSRRILTVRPTNPFPITLAGRTITISKRESEDTRRIEIDRENGKAPVTIWSLNKGVRRVDRATYARILGLRWW